MTSSDDNDKTVIKTSTLKPGDADDKTRIAPRVTRATSEQDDQKTQIKIPRVLPAADDSDKTRVTSKPVQSQGASGVEESTDKTRITPKTSSASEPSDKTQIIPRTGPIKSSASSAQDSDKTRITPKTAPEGSDKTRIIPKNTGSMDSPDKTRIVVKKTPPETQASDKTRIVEKKESVTSDVRDTTQFSPAKTIPPLAPHEKTSREETQLNPAIARMSMTNEEASSEYGVLKNRFVFEELLGAGGMGVVYKAKDLLKVEAQDRDPYVAIKVLGDEFKSHPEAFIALQRESRKTQKIAHPNIVNVYDFDRDGETVFMTMEFMEGKPLDKLISQYRSVGLATEDVVKILEGICAALTYAHGQEIIHSDFKPGNIFVTNHGVAKVFDFGIARAVAKAEHREESLDDRTVFDAGNLGALTPAYASLEMLEGKVPDVRDDIYALGCIAYELFTGEHPYNRAHADEAKRQKLKLKRIPGIPKRQWRAIERALAFDRENRTESVEAFWREFTQITSHTTKILFSLIVLMLLGAGAYFQFKPAEQPGFTEDQFRSEIEKKLRLELKMQALADLYATADFSAAWEKQLWDDIQELRRILGTSDTWLLGEEGKFYALYISKIEELITANQLTLAQQLLVNAQRYGTDAQKINDLEQKIAIALEAQKKQELARQQQQLVREKELQQVAQQADVVKKQNSAFDVALENVNQQLACRSHIDMKDFDIAITKLRSLNTSRYNKEESRITGLLAKCIERVGSSFPERAKDAKKDALRIFKGNATIAAINIVPKDPCSSSLAGLGARGLGASCRDRLSGASKAPAMVVIPGKGSMKTFAIGKYEITTEELNEYCAQTKACAVGSGDGSLPATNISISVATGYLKWLSDKASRRYRLPTYAEWQYAAKAGAGRADPNRNCKLNSRGIQKGNAPIKVSIGQQNAWGVVNYLGNAREWVAERGGQYLAVGGSYETQMEECDFNSSVPHDGRADSITGFRVLREVDG